MIFVSPDSMWIRGWYCGCGHWPGMVSRNVVTLIDPHRWWPAAHHRRRHRPHDPLCHEYYRR